MVEFEIQSYVRDLKVGPEEGAAILEAFHAKRIGWSMPALEPTKRNERSITREYQLYYSDSKGRGLIIFEPGKHGGSILTTYPNETELWAYRLYKLTGRDIREFEEMQGVLNLIHDSTSPIIEAFCKQFIEELEQRKLTGKPNWWKRNQDWILKIVAPIFTGVVGFFLRELINLFVLPLLTP